MHLIQMVGCPPELVQGMCHWDVIDTCHLGEMLTLEDWGAMRPVGVGLTLEGTGACARVESEMSVGCSSSRLCYNLHRTWSPRLVGAGPIFAI